MKASFRFVLAALPLVAVGSMVGCGVHSDKAVAKAAIDTSSKSQRDDGYEATAQLLDEKPELVDELYATMRKHPKAMDRFLQNASNDLDEKWVAHNMATYLSRRPAAVEAVLSESIPAIAKEPKSRAAMNRALAANSDMTADILTDDPQAMAKIIKSLLTVTEKKPGGRKNMITAIHEDREALIAFAKEDPELARAIAVEVVKEAVKDKPTLEKTLAAVGALEPPKGAPTPSLPPVNAKTAPKGEEARGQGEVQKK